MNLASSFVNGFVNAAFGQDKLLTDDGNKWLYKNKDHGTKSKLRLDLISAWQWEMTEAGLWFSGMLSAAASLGMILLWDVDGGLTQIDKYLYSSEDYIKVLESHTFHYWSNADLRDQRELCSHRKKNI